jgi:LysM repeat protein
MVRFARALALLVCCAPGALLAQGDSGSNAPAGDELKILRQMLEQQSKQIDVLAQEIARLNLLLESKTPTAAGLASSPAEAPAAAPAEPSAPAALPADTAETPKALPAGPVHIVAKGETLTAIAKRYKVTVPDLLKVNKIADVRKLQIGQTLALPPGAKVPESPTPSPQP